MCIDSFNFVEIIFVTAIGMVLSGLADPRPLFDLTCSELLSVETGAALGVFVDPCGGPSSTHRHRNNHGPYDAHAGE